MPAVTTPEDPNAPTWVKVPDRGLDVKAWETANSTAPRTPFWGHFYPGGRRSFKCAVRDSYYRIMVLQRK